MTSRADLIDRLVTGLREVVAEYARQEGIDVVVKLQDMDVANLQEQALRLATTEVIYASDALDVTGVVVDRLNAAYAGPIEEK